MNSPSSVQKRHTAIIVCAGIGVGSWGLKNAGFDAIAAVERDARFAERYALNYPAVKILNQDVRDVDITALMTALEINAGDLDLYQASPSCKHFSQANRNKGEKDEDIEVSEAIASQIAQLNPKAVLIEQVSAYAKSESWKLLNKSLVNRYNLQIFKLNAADYGTPQSRIRFFAVGTRKDIGSAPQQIPATGEKQSWFEAIADLIEQGPLIPAREGLAPWQIKRLKALSQVDFATLFSSRANTLPKASVAPAFTLSASRHVHRALLIERVGTHGDKLRTWQSDNIAPTIRAFGKKRHWHKFSVVLGKQMSVDELLDNALVYQLTPRCLARLMGLPDEFELSGNNPVDAEGLGNGIAVQAIEAIARQIAAIFP